MYICVDTETTGLEARVHSLLTGTLMVADDDLEIRGRYSFQLKSDVYHCHPRALIVNGIPLSEHHSVARSAEEISTEITDFLHHHTYGPNPKCAGELLTPIGHNFPFDLRFLQEHLPLVEWSRYLSHRILDTQVLANFFKSTKTPGYSESAGLESLAKHYGIEHRAHTSEGDVLATLELLRRYQRYMYAVNGHAAATGVAI